MVRRLNGVKDVFKVKNHIEPTDTEKLHCKRFYLFIYFLISLKMKPLLFLNSTNLEEKGGYCCFNINVVLYEHWTCQNSENYT